MEEPQDPGPGIGFREGKMRELGVLRPAVFTRRLRSAEAIVKRLIHHATLYPPDCFIRTVHFNQSGDVLVSGDDDKRIILWNWLAESQKLSYHSGHTDPVFEARIMPFTDDRRVVTSGADGEVRFGQISENWQPRTRLLGTHQGRAHKLAIEPGKPNIFYSCGDDGLVQKFDLRTSPSTKLLSCSSFDESREPVPLFTIAINPQNPNYFSVGGLGEYARVYDVRRCSRKSIAGRSDLPVEKFSPPHLIGSGHLQITGLAYSNQSELLVSYNDEQIYLFPKNMDSNHVPQGFFGRRNLTTGLGVNFFGPNDEYVVSGSYCGHIFIWKKKDGALIRMMMGDMGIVNCVEPHPHFPFLASTGLETNMKLWMPTANQTTPHVPNDAIEIIAANMWERETDAQLSIISEIVRRPLQ